jgi:Plant transposon protein
MEDSSLLLLLLLLRRLRSRQIFVSFRFQLCLMCCGSTTDQLRRGCTTRNGFRLDKSGVVPYKVGDESFNRTFMLVDGIYPKYSRFIGTVKQPITQRERSFSAWQESARKDIKRAFGILQNRWQAIEHVIHTQDPNRIPHMIAACVILHNMRVSERIMGDVHTTYDPIFGLDLDPEHPEVRHTVKAGKDVECIMGISHFDKNTVQALMERKVEMLALDDSTEWRRLHQALQHLKGDKRAH